MLDYFDIEQHLILYIPRKISILIESHLFPCGIFYASQRGLHSIEGDGTMAEQLLPVGFGRCEITNKVVPEEELVTIQGKRVCAEGKAILLEHLKAGELLSGELEKPSIGLRFGCSFLDGIILGIPYMIVLFAFIGGAVVANAGGKNAPPPVATANFYTGLLAVAFAIVSVCYFGFMHGKFSQTLGKMAGKTKVIRLDGLPMDYQTAFIRAMMYQGLGVISGLLTMLSIPILSPVVSMLIGFYGLANMIVALIDSKQQRAIHDLVAGTRVVKVVK